MMGKQKSTSNALAKTLDAEGKVRYDIIAKQGHGKDKVWQLFAFPVMTYYYLVYVVVNFIGYFCCLFTHSIHA